MPHRIALTFECISCDVTIDVYMPLPGPIQESAEAMADRQPHDCPTCHKAMTYSGFGFEREDRTGLV